MHPQFPTTIHYSINILLISQQPVCCRGETRVSQAKPKARQARVKESRYVIKVLNVKWKGGTVPEVHENQRMHAPVLLIGQ
jgi:hypothetical protein